MNRLQHDARSAAKDILTALRAAGHAAYFAGGCVRDMLLGLPPTDFDIATDAHPQSVLKLYPRARKVGVKFGVVLVRRFGHDIEVATFRTDGHYSDGRHPDAVTFGSDREDALRRDFTINGLFYDPIEDRVIDYINGRDDLDGRIIRTIGEPRLRFHEDHLRMLRAVRFGAKLGFTIEPVTFAAIAELAPSLCSISPERVWMELEAILTAPSRAMGWSLLVETGLVDYLAASWDISSKQGGETRLIHKRLRALGCGSIEAQLAMAAALAARPESSVRAVGRDLRLSNRLLRAVAWLVSHLPDVRNEAALELADLKSLMADDEWPNLLRLFEADIIARGDDRAEHRRLCTRASSIRPEDVAPPPLLSGNDLLAFGVVPGPLLGRIHDQVYRAQRNETIKTADEARALARQMMREIE